LYFVHVQNIFTDVPEYNYRFTENKKNMYKTCEAGTPDINTGEAGIGHKKFNATAKPINAPAKPAFRRNNL